MISQPAPATLLHVHAIPCVREGSSGRKSCANTRPMDDGCGAGSVATMTFHSVGMDGFMQLATAAQRRKNLDTIHGAKREEDGGFPTVREHE